MGKTMDYTPSYGTDLSNDENAESILKMLIGLPTEFITQGESKIHKEVSKTFLH